MFFGRFVFLLYFLRSRRYFLVVFGTIGDNLKYGLKREITEEEFRNACRETFVDQFVSTLPDGYQTVISNEMSSLSAGEKQLLTICRAFLVKPNILILDEATSSVDTRTEAMIDQAPFTAERTRTMLPFGPGMAPLIASTPFSTSDETMVRFSAVLVT